MVPLVDAVELVVPVVIRVAPVEDPAVVAAAEVPAAVVVVELAVEVDNNVPLDAVAALIMASVVDPLVAVVPAEPPVVVEALAVVEEVVEDVPLEAADALANRVVTVSPCDVPPLAVAPYSNHPRNTSSF